MPFEFNDPDALLDQYEDYDDDYGDEVWQRDDDMDTWEDFTDEFDEWEMPPLTIRDRIHILKSNIKFYWHLLLERIGIEHEPDFPF